jgi:hypothetical protein
MTLRTLPVLLLAVAAAAQSPVAPTEKAAPHQKNVVGGPPGTLQPWREVVHDTDADGTLYAAAPSYKASFRADGVTFMPFLGSDLPTNLSLELRLDDVQLAGRSLGMHRTAPQRDGERITYERGSFRENYDLALAGIEQSFQFDALDVRGELAFAVRATTTLQPHAADGGLAFTHERGHVTYTQAIAIDANGRRLALPTTLQDGVIHFAVPAAFVAEAALPLVVDPIVGTYYQGPTLNYQISGKDLAYDASADEWHVAWSFPFSQSDSDLYLQRYTGGFVPIGSPMAIDTTLDSWLAPSIANLALYDKFLVVARKWVAGSFRVGGRITAAATTTPVGAQFEIEGPAAAGNLGQQAYGYDVGGDPSQVGPTYWTVAFESHNGNDSDIYLRQVTDAGVLRGNAPTVVADTAQDEIMPRISKSNGNGNFQTQAWGIVYNHNYSNLRGRSVAWNGAMINTFRTLAVGVTSHQAYDISSPTDETNGQRHMMFVYESPDQAQVSQDVRGQILDRAMVPQGLGASLTSLALSAGDNNRDQSEPTVDSDGVRFVVGYKHDFSAPDFDIHAAVFHRDPAPQSGLRWVQTDAVSTAIEAEDRPKVCAATSGGGGRLRYGFVWERAVSATTDRLEAVNYEGLQAGAQMATRPTGCGGLQIGYTGSPLAGETLTVQKQNGQGFGGFVAGFPVNLPIPGCGGCLQGVQGFTTIGSQVAVQIPTTGAFCGMTISFQAFDLGVGPCLSQVNLSDTIDATIR